MKKLMVGIAALVLLGLLVPAQGARIRRCMEEPATIVGTRGADRIKGTEKEDVVVALAGADRISGLGDNDRICGGRGADTIYVSSPKGFQTCAGGPGLESGSGGKGKDRIFGGGSSFYAQGDLGDDLIDGCNLGAGARVVNYTHSATAVSVNLTTGVARGQGADTIRHINLVVGSDFNDTLTGSDRQTSEQLRGWFGNDFIEGLGGPDELQGGDGDDNIDGEDGVEGNDFIAGYFGDDTCTADANDQVIDCES